MKRPIGGALLAALAAAAALAACGSDENTATEAASTQAAQEAVADPMHQPLDCTTEMTVDQMLSYRVPKANKPYKITLLQVSLAAYYYQAMAYGAQKAADEAGVDLKIESSSGYQSAAQQLSQAQTALAQNPDAIVLQPADTEGSVAIVNEAMAKGIPVVNISTELNSDDALVVMQDDYQQGKLAADAIAAQLPEGGQGIVQGGPENATWARKRVAGFEDQIKAKYPDLKISTVTHEQTDPAEGLQKFTDAAQAHPQVDWIYAVNSVLLLPDSVPAANRDAVYVAGGLEPMVIDALEQGTIDAALPADQVAMGYVGVGTAIAKLNGEEPPQVQCLPQEVVTKKTVDSPYAQGELYPAGYKAAGG